MIKTLQQFVLVVLVCVSFSASAESTLSKKTETLKKSAVELNRELFKLEEELLYPADTQIVVFLSVATAKTFLIDSVELMIDGQLATTYLYQDKEVKALEKGGIQKLYIGNISNGPHKIEAVFNGQGSDEKYFRRKSRFSFEKSNTAKYLELAIVDSRNSLEPSMKINEWR